MAVARSRFVPTMDRPRWICFEEKPIEMKKPRARTRSPKKQTHESKESNMKTHLILSILAALTLGQAALLAFEQPAVQKITAKDHIVIFGDSTSGRRPAGYVELLTQALNEQVPGVKHTTIAKAQKWTGDLPSMIPYLVKMLPSEQPPTICIIVLGLNDRDVDVYAKNLREAVGVLRGHKQTVILTTPTLFNDLNKMKAHAKAVQDLATELKCPLIDLSAAYTDYAMKNMKDNKFLPGTGLYDNEQSAIGLHLGQMGEILSAKTIIQALGLKPEWKMYQICLRVNGKGQIKADPAPTGDKGREGYAPGTKVTLTFTPDAGFKFNRWFNFEGTVKETSEKLTVTMDRPMWIFAESKP